MKEGFKNVVKRIDYILTTVSYLIRKKRPNNRIIEKKNIMILIYKLNNGGAERVAANLSNELNELYNVVLITCADKKENDYNCFSKRIILNDKKIFNNFCLVKQLIKIKKENNITHTISFGSKMNFLNVMSNSGDKSIISIRSYLKYSKHDMELSHFNRIAGKYADKVVVVSNMLIDEQIQDYNVKKEQIDVIYNFVDEKTINNCLEGKTIKKEKNVVLNVGRLDEQKGQLNLIKSFKNVVEKIPDAKLIILGEGPLKEKLLKLINELKLSKNVFIEGFKNNPYEYMKKATILISTSIYEGMSNVILEAMCCNLPIIATDCIAGSREIIAPDTDLNQKNNSITLEEYGILIPTENNEKHITESIINLLQNKELQNNYSKKSKERIKDFSKEIIIKKWINLIEIIN